MNWIRLLFKASKRAGQRKTNAVFARLMRHVANVGEDFDLIANIHGILLEDGQVRIRTYSVGDLRKFPASARIIGFEDKEHYRPDQQLRFVIPYGWIPKFTHLTEQPELPPEIAKRYENVEYILDPDRPMPEQIRADIEDVPWWIKDFRE